MSVIARKFFFFASQLSLKNKTKQNTVLDFMAGSETHYRNSFIPQTTVKHFFKYTISKRILTLCIFHPLKISLKVFTILKHVPSASMYNLSYWGKTC